MTFGMFWKNAVWSWTDDDDDGGYLLAADLRRTSDLNSECDTTHFTTSPTGPKASSNHNLPCSQPNTEHRHLSRDPSSSQQLMVNIIRGKDGFGFTICSDCPVRVQAVDPGGPAHQSGLHQGDSVLQLNGLAVETWKCVDLAHTIRSSSRIVLVVRRGLPKLWSGCPPAHCKLLQSVYHDGTRTIGHLYQTYPRRTQKFIPDFRHGSSSTNALSPPVPPNNYSNYQNCTIVQSHLACSVYRTYINLAPKTLIFPIFVQPLDLCSPSRTLLMSEEMILHQSDLLPAKDPRSSNLQLRMKSKSLATDVQSRMWFLQRRKKNSFFHSNNLEKALRNLRPSVAEALSWAESLEALLSNQYGITVFRHFLRSEFSEENLDFWLAVEKLKQTRPLSKMGSRAEKIYADFISTSAVRQVNVDSCQKGDQSKSQTRGPPCVLPAGPGTGVWTDGDEQLPTILEVPPLHTADQSEYS